MSDTDESYHYREPNETHTPPTDDDGTLLASQQWVTNTVRALVAEPTEDVGVMDLVTSRPAVNQEAKKCGIDQSDAEAALDEAIQEDRIFAAPEWGHLDPLSEEHLVAVQEAEIDTDRPRGAFIGACHKARLLIREREGPTVEAVEVPSDD